MSFWKTDRPLDGSAKNCTSFKEIKDNSLLISELRDVSIKEHEGIQYYSLNWLIIDDEHKGMYVRQSVKPNILDDDKRAAALNMLVRLFRLNGLDIPNDEPTILDFSSMYFKRLYIHIRSKEIAGVKRTWVENVYKSLDDLETPKGMYTGRGNNITVGQVNHDHNFKDEAMNRAPPLGASASFNDDEIPF